MDDFLGGSSFCNIKSTPLSMQHYSNICDFCNGIYDYYIYNYNYI